MTLSYRCSLNEALSKIYIIKYKVYKGRVSCGFLSFPNCLAGKRIKIELVEDKKEAVKNTFFS